MGMPPRLCLVQGVPVPSESTGPHAHGQCGLAEASPRPQLSSSTRSWLTISIFTVTPTSVCTINPFARKTKLYYQIIKLSWLSEHLITLPIDHLCM